MECCAPDGVGRQAHRHHRAHRATAAWQASRPWLAIVCKIKAVGAIDLVVRIQPTLAFVVQANPQLLHVRLELFGGKILILFLELFDARLLMRKLDNVENYYLLK